MKRKKITNYAQKRLKEIKAGQRKKQSRAPRNNKVVQVEIKTTGFYLFMDYEPENETDRRIMAEANKLIERRAV